MSDRLLRLAHDAPVTIRSSDAMVTTFFLWANKGANLPRAVFLVIFFGAAHMCVAGAIHGGPRPLFLVRH
jgi:hypothetical protein